MQAIHRAIHWQDPLVESHQVQDLTLNKQRFA